MHDMTIGAPPLGAFVNRQAFEECRGVGRPVGDATGEAGLLGAKECFAYDRMYAISSNDQRRLDATAIGKHESGSCFVLLDRDQLSPEVNAVGRDQGSKH